MGLSDTRVGALIGFGTLALIVAGVSIWQLNPFEARSPWAPACADLAGPIQSTTGSAWAAAEDDDPSRCTLAFSSPDRRHSGTVSVLVEGTSDEDAARRDAEVGPCVGTPVTGSAPAGFSVHRMCSSVTGSWILTSLAAAKGERSARMTMNLSIPDGEAPADTEAFARDTLNELADLALSLRED